MTRTNTYFPTTVRILAVLGSCHKSALPRFAVKIARVKFIETIELSQNLFSWLVPFPVQKLTGSHLQHFLNCFRFPVCPCMSPNSMGGDAAPALLQETHKKIKKL